MPRFGVLVAVLGGLLALIGLTVALLPGESGAPEASASEISNGKVTTITVESSGGEVTWGRLRWLLAGLSISSVVLVTSRQFAVAAGPRRRHSSSVRRAPEATAPAANSPAYDSLAAGWMPDAPQVSIGD
jgi:hypothetical protein